MNIIYPTEGKYLYWEENWAPYIAVPLTEDANAIMAQCVEYTEDEIRAIQEARREEEEANGNIEV